MSAFEAKAVCAIRNGMPVFIDHETEGTRLVFVDGYEEPFVFGRQTLPAVRGKTFEHARRSLQGHGRNHDPVIGMFHLKPFPVLPRD